MTDLRALFNPQPRVERRQFSDGQSCLVIEDALSDPQRLRQFALQQRERFAQAPFNAYPGIELAMPDEFRLQLADFFARHVRSLLGGRRTLKMACRLAMTTTPAAALEPRQRICHRDSAWVAPEQRIAASVLYLFEDPALGGTSFYAPKLAPAETERLVHDSSTLDNEAFTRQYRLAPAYMTGSNEFFERIGGVDARWNRMVFYDGRTFHSGDIGSPQALSADPMHGRLTVNGFFTCSRNAS